MWDVLFGRLKVKTSSRWHCLTKPTNNISNNSEIFTLTSLILKVYELLLLLRIFMPKTSFNFISLFCLLAKKCAHIFNTLYASARCVFFLVLIVNILGVTKATSHMYTAQVVPLTFLDSKACMCLFTSNIHNYIGGRLVLLTSTVKL